MTTKKTTAKTTAPKSTKLAPELLADLAGTIAALVLSGPAIRALALTPYASFIETFAARLRPAATRIVCGILKENPGLLTQGWKEKAADMMDLVTRYEDGRDNEAANRAQFSIDQAQRLFGVAEKKLQTQSDKSLKSDGPIVYSLRVSKS